ncbi:MAG: prepilin-type N-terminal cleavage/methylation domain-containing protein [Candidatus Omnitrophica bacterium]|nr:prepilin-type N-terminal cleavage/methylation domain-containing protein [Candidatus Omnitrophota bacterium]
MLRKKKKGSQSGFTMMETVVSMSILGTLLLSTNIFMKPATDLWVLQAFRDSSEHEARLSLLRIVRELSQIRNDQSVSSAESSRITFTNTSGQEVTIKLLGTELLRNNVVLARNIAAFELAYWGYDQSSIANPVVSPSETNIYSISILIRAAANGRSSTLRTRVHPRNFYA